MVDRHDLSCVGVAEPPGKLPLLGKTDFMAVQVVGFGLMPGRALQLAGDVLVKGAAERNVDELHAPADSQDRLSGLDKFVEQLHLVGIANPVAGPFFI